MIAYKNWKWHTENGDRTKQSKKEQIQMEFAFLVAAIWTSYHKQQRMRAHTPTIKSHNANENMQDLVVMLLPLLPLRFHNHNQRNNSNNNHGSALKLLLQMFSLTTCLYRILHFQIHEHFSGMQITEIEMIHTIDGAFFVLHEHWFRLVIVHLQFPKVDFHKLLRLLLHLYL